MALDPGRVVSQLRELQELTGDENGAQRVAWTDTWNTARAWLDGLLDGLPLERERDAAGNDWWTLRGDSERAVLIGGHIDSVPNGGWLDGCLNVVAGAEVLRRIAEQGTPPVTIRLVNWADEEGARFGRSLFGSSAAAGSMSDQDELRQLTDRDGISLPEALAANGVDLDRALEARSQLETRRGLPRAPHRAGPGARVDGHPARRRARHLRRRALAHHVDGPGRARRLDADGQAPRRARRRGEARARAPRDRGPGRERRRLHVGRRRLPARHRHLRRRDRRAAPRPAPPRRRRAWRSCCRLAQEASERFAAEENLEVAWERIWNIEPILFDPALIDLCDDACREVAGTSHRLPSGPLHDAAEVARAGVPTVMLFVQSLRGLSHTKLEDTREEHLELSVRRSTGSPTARSPGSPPIR